MKLRGFKLYLTLVLVVCAAFGAYCAILAQGPDREIVFTREVTTEAPQTDIDQDLWSLKNWPKWFFTTAAAERVDIAKRPLPMKDQVIEPGARIKLSIDPKKGRHRRFEILTVVTDYIPQKQVTLKIVEDTSGRLTRLFSLIEWKIELIPGSEGQLPRIRGTQIVRTQHWRARLFGSLSERILMHQVFYPDLVTLSGFKQPLAPNPGDPEAQ